MLSHLITPPQKTEPKRILCSRYLVIVVSLSFLICSFIILCVKMVNEAPNISTSLTTTNNLLAPVIDLGFGFDFTISCLLYYNYNGTNVRKCDEYITQPKIVGNDDYPFVGKFSPILPNSLNITLNRYEDPVGPYFVFLNIKIVDPNITFNDTAQDSSFRMVAYDSENEYDTLNKNFVAPTNLFDESLFYLNKYTLSSGMIYKFGFAKKVRRVIVQDFLSYFGFPTYLSKPYIESTIQNIPMNSNEENITVRISPRNFVIEEEREQRGDTLLSILGTIAAFYSSVVFIYVFLFGVDSMKPWGILHGFCGFRKLKVEKQGSLLKIVPPDIEKDSKKKVGILHGFFGFFKVTPSGTEEIDGLKQRYDSEEQGHDLEFGLEGNRNLENLENLETHLEKRIAVLEEFNHFLRSDIIDISLLENFKKKKARQ